MTIRAELVQEVSDQVIWFYPQEGRPSAKPTVELKNKYGSTDLAAANTYVTQGTVNTTSNGATTKKATTMILDSVTGIEFRKSYLITNALSQTEWVRIKSINASTKVVEFDEPLEYAHADEATFQDTGFYYTFQDAQVASLLDANRARAVYTAGGVSYTVEQNYDVVLTKIPNPLTVEFIKKRRTGIMKREHSQTLGSDLEDYREVAFESVKKGIRNHDSGWRPALVKTPEQLSDWALAEFDLLAHANGIKILKDDWDPQQAIEHLENERNKQRNFTLNNLEFMDLNDDDGKSTDEETPRRPDFVR